MKVILTVKDDDRYPENIKKQEQNRVLKYLRGLLELNPKASLAATIDLIETTNPEKWG